MTGSAPGSLLQMSSWLGEQFESAPPWKHLLNAGTFLHVFAWFGPAPGQPLATSHMCLFRWAPGERSEAAPGTVQLPCLIAARVTFHKTTTCWNNVLCIYKCTLEGRQLVDSIWGRKLNMIACLKWPHLFLSSSQLACHLNSLLRICQSFDHLDHNW